MDTYPVSACDHPVMSDMMTPFARARLVDVRFILQFKFHYTPRNVGSL